MESAPRDATPVDLWRNGERLTNYRRVKLAPDNVFYEPVESGYSCVRDAEYWQPLPPPPNGAIWALAQVGLRPAALED